MAVILEPIGGERPNFILSQIVAEGSRSIGLDELRGAFDKLHLHLAHGQYLLAAQILLRTLVLDGLQLVNHVLLPLDVSQQRALLLLVLPLLVDLGVLQILGKAGAALPRTIGVDASVLVVLLPGNIAGDDVLGEGHEVHSRAGELGVLGPAVLASDHLELIEAVLALVPQLAVEFEVEVALPEDGNQAVIGERVDERVDQGLNHVDGPALGDEVGVEEERVLVVDDDAVDRQAAEAAVRDLGQQPDFAALEDEQVEVVLLAEQYLLGVGHPGLDGLGQGEEGLLHDVVEEVELLEGRPVGLLQVVHPVSLGQVLHELGLLVDVELLADVGVLLDEVVDLLSQLVLYAVLISQPLEDLQVAPPLEVLRADVRDERPHAADVIGEDDAAHSLDEHHAAGLLVAHRHDISEPHSQHHRRAPVVGPGVLLEPGGVLDPLPEHPVLLADARHLQQHDGESVSEAKVKEEHLHQRPVLLVVVVLDDLNLEPFEPFEAVREFKDNEQAKREQRPRLYTQAEQAHEQIRKIKVEPLLPILLQDLSESLELAAETEAHSCQVDDDFAQEQQYPEAFEDSDVHVGGEIGEDDGHAGDEDRNSYIDEEDDAQDPLLRLLQLVPFVVQEGQLFLPTLQLELNWLGKYVIPPQLVDKSVFQPIHLLSSDEILESLLLFPPDGAEAIFQSRRVEIFRIDEGVVVLRLRSRGRPVAIEQHVLACI